MLVCSSALTASIPKTGHRLDLLCPFQKYCLWVCGSPRQRKPSTQQLLPGGEKKTVRNREQVSVQETTS